MKRIIILRKLSHLVAQLPVWEVRSAIRFQDVPMFIRLCALPVLLIRAYRSKATLPGKLPQRKITVGAAAGYSSYGNQIGLATGHVQEYYHDKFVAKRMEIGAVIGAAPRDTVRRERPSAGDLIVLLGGRTGRDGCGGATGSS